MIIDSHQHVFWMGRDDAGLAADMDAQGIDHAWLLTWQITAQEHEPNHQVKLNPARCSPEGMQPGVTLQDLIVARDRYPERFTLGYCPNPRIDAAPDLFEAAVNMHHVRVCGEWKFRMLLDDPRCLNLFRKAGELGCPVVLHLDLPYLPTGEGGASGERGGSYQRRWYGGTVENLARALRACPETAFIGHAPAFWREISGDAPRDPAVYPATPVTPGGRLYELFEEHPNLHADLSAGSGLYALQRDPQHALMFIQRFADRLLFGRDQYGGKHQGFLNSLDLSEETRNRIMYKNARRLTPASRLPESTGTQNA